MLLSITEDTEAQRTQRRKKSDSFRRQATGTPFSAVAGYCRPLDNRP
jgi:hypothetical protein